MTKEIASEALAAAPIELVFSPASLGDAAEDRVRRILNIPREQLVHGASYTGRPYTWIYRDSEYLIKVRAEYRFPTRDARRWIERAREQEQRLGVHHPAKGWFLIHADEVALIANITPKMTPLHTLGEEYSQTDRCALLERMLDLYLGVAANHKQRLDEGLSNFAIGADGELYYVDDDIYRWDELTSLTQAMGFWCRALPWFTAEVAERIGQVLHQLLERHFRDRHTLMVAANLIRQLPLVNPEQERRRAGLLQGLESAAPRKPSSRPKTLGQEPFALLGDIHANYPALQAVLAALDRLGIRQALVLGDTVGYGPYPLECIRAVRERDFTVIKGNHDYAVVTGQFIKGFSKNAQAVAEWTRNRLDAEDLAWLDELPPSLHQDGWLAVHGAPQDKHCFFGYVYRMSYEANLANLAERDIPICFHGHSHITGVYFRDQGGESGFCKENQQSLQHYSYCLVSPGSIGQPRDNEGPAAPFAIFDPQTRQLAFHRVDYPVETTIDAMLANDFPAALAQRLRNGE
ncbi:MAG: metallophosphoesterase family protein [Candidatus Contendobacter sp.]|nr:metallophosphoesterase family protein [Candidatus Contendobacter sp.]MDG4557082.1 metallophosphoesterase family protein [Candidatus Contendobacter sp.]